MRYAIGTLWRKFRRMMIKRSLRKQGYVFDSIVASGQQLFTENYALTLEDYESVDVYVDARPFGFWRYDLKVSVGKIRLLRRDEGVLEMEDLVQITPNQLHEYFMGGELIRHPFNHDLRMFRP